MTTGDAINWKPEGGSCPECSGSLAVPDLGDGEDGYAPCPACVVDAGETFVVWEESKLI